MSEYIGKMAKGFDPICTLRGFKRQGVCDVPTECANCGWEQANRDDRIKSIQRGHDVQREDGLLHLTVAAKAKPGKKPVKGAKAG